MEKEKKEKNAESDKVKIATAFNDSPKINNYLKSLNTKQSKRNYRAPLLEFFILINEDPEIYLKNLNNLTRKQERLYKEKVEDDVNKYLTYIKNDRTVVDKKTNKEIVKPIIQTALPLSALKELFKFSRLALDDIFWKQLRKKSNGKKKGKTGWLSLPQLREILSEASLEAKAFFLVQMTSMSRISEIVTLGFDDIKLECEFPRIVIKAENSKNGEPMRKRISPEAKTFLLDYLKHRNEIIATRNRRTPTNRKKTYDPNLIFPMSSQNAEVMWKTLVDNAKLYKLDPTTKRPEFGTHALRRYGCTHLENEDMANFFRGERTASNTAYFGYDDEQIDKIYKEKVDNLFVLQTPENITYKMELWEADSDAKTKQIEDLKGTNKLLSDRIKILENKVNQRDRILNAKTNDEIDPITPLIVTRFKDTIDDKTLTSEQREKRLKLIDQYKKQQQLTPQDQQYEEQLEKKALQNRLQVIKHLQQTKPEYKDSEIIYRDGIPFINTGKQEPKPEIVTFQDTMKQLIEARDEQQKLNEEQKKINEEMKQALKKINKK